MDQFETLEMHSKFESLMLNEVTIPPSRKIVIANVKHIVSTQHTSENYLT